MTERKIISITDNPQFKNVAAEWFSSKWKVPKTAYEESMKEAISGDKPVPQWYMMLEDSRIIAGIGIIENDFHNRPDLTPNICAVYTEPDKRGQGIAGKLLRFACEDMHNNGIDTLYLLTDHTEFYERYGWQFYCMVQGRDKEESRMYIHKMME